MEAPERNGRRKLFERLAFIPAGLVLLYAVLLIPEAREPLPATAGRQPFAWARDAFWSELERQFAAARGTGCDSMAAQVDAALGRINTAVGELRRNQFAATNAIFASLEREVFTLASMVGACPRRLPDYLAAVTQARAAVKQQSERWDLDQPSVRQTLYRHLFGSRMALEEVLLQAPSTNGVSPLVPGDDEPSPTPAITIAGVTLHSGDILVSRGGAPTSALIARGNDFPGSFSHVALLHVDPETGRASVIESHIECGVVITSFEEYLRDKKLRILALRLRSNLPALAADPLLPHKAAARAFEAARQRHIPYDFAMDTGDHAAQFCSEVAAAAYEALGIKLWAGMSHISSPTVAAWLGSLGVRQFTTQAPADLESDPQLRLIAEWRDPATLFKAHVDDAVTDAMLAAARPGEPLDYNWWLLPVTRVAKAYSVVLNSLGKTGPVPEGMSATTALRIAKYRRDHGAIAARVLALAADFTKQNGYAPPYWKLLSLANKAQAEIRGVRTTAI